MWLGDKHPDSHSVDFGWSIYPLGYFFGYLKGAVDGSILGTLTYFMVYGFVLAMIRCSISCLCRFGYLKGAVSDSSLKLVLIPRTLASGLSGASGRQRGLHCHCQGHLHLLHGVLLRPDNVSHHHLMSRSVAAGSEVAVLMLDGPSTHWVTSSFSWRVQLATAFWI